MKNRLVRLVLLVIIATVAYFFQVGRQEGDGATTSPAISTEASPPGSSPPGSPPAESTARTPRAHREDGEARVLEAFARGESDFVTEVGATVSRLLADDDDGDRHQKFVIELPRGHTLLVAHNIDLADRVPAKVGDQVRIRGEYEYNDRGGVLHWTHRAKGRNHEDGWIEHRGVRYW